MKGNRLSYETVRVCDCSIACRTDTIDFVTWDVSYNKGYRPARYPVPAIPLEVSIQPIWVISRYVISGCVWHRMYERTFANQYWSYANHTVIHASDENYLKWVGYLRGQEHAYT